MTFFSIFSTTRLSTLTSVLFGTVMALSLTSLMTKFMSRMSSLLCTSIALSVFSNTIAFIIQWLAAIDTFPMITVFFLTGCPFNTGLLAIVLGIEYKITLVLNAVQEDLSLFLSLVYSIL